MSLAQSIRARRQARGLTQRQLAAAVHRSRTTIAQYERGYAIPPLVVVQRMAQALECSLTCLLDEEAPDDPPA